MTEEKLALQEKVKEKVALLKKMGGFRILEGIVDGKKGIRDMNPKDEPRRVAFLTDDDKEKKRNSLKSELTLLKELLSSESQEEAIETARNKSNKAAEILNENLTKAIEKNKQLETSYRSMDLFFRNAEEEGMRNLYFINMATDEFISPDATYRADVEDHFDDKFDRFSLENNYSLFVLPGYLGNQLDVFSKMAKKYRVTLVTDYNDAKYFEDIEDGVEEEKVGGDDPFKSNTIMTCNYGAVRKKYDGLEDEDLFVPLSVALAGKMYSSNGIQPPSGKRHGKLDGVLGTRLDLRKKQVDKIDKMGMVPVIYEGAWGTVAMSDVTLCVESTDPDLRALGVVRSMDWIAKVLLDYFNSLTFQVFDGNLRKEITRELNNFFNKIKGHGKLIEEYKITKIEKDPNNPQAVKIGINVKPFFAVKHYIIDFSGTQGDFSEEDE
jgi:hypothetical protein